jgi:hypothetical protein
MDAKTVLAKPQAAALMESLATAALPANIKKIAKAKSSIIAAIMSSQPWIARNMHRKVMLAKLSICLMVLPLQTA